MTKRIITKNCKLLDEDVLAIRALRKQGNTLESLARKFSVSTHTIAYWTKSLNEFESPEPGFTEVNKIKQREYRRKIAMTDEKRIAKARAFLGIE